MLKTELAGYPTAPERQEKNGVFAPCCGQDFPWKTGGSSLFFDLEQSHTPIKIGCQDAGSAQRHDGINDADTNFMLPFDRTRFCIETKHQAVLGAIENDPTH